MYIFFGVKGVMNKLDIYILIGSIIISIIGFICILIGSHNKKLTIN